MLTKKGWQPTVRLASTRSSSQDKAALGKIEKSFSAALARVGVSTRATGVRIDLGEGTSRVVTPTLELTVIMTSTSVACFASATDLIPGTKRTGIVWQSYVLLSDEHKGSKAELDAFQTEELERCALTLSHHFEQDMARNANDGIQRQ
ncbi:MAG: hypothetical protein Q8N23_36915 [Archangium sp.]|nr:hypothetical protein [Archangium sp.]MDP3569595.1 hypothetical protein [Archangium sp.]